MHPHKAEARPNLEPKQEAEYTLRPPAHAPPNKTAGPNRLLQARTRKKTSRANHTRQNPNQAKERPAHGPRSLIGAPQPPSLPPSRSGVGEGAIIIVLDRLSSWDSGGLTALKLRIPTASGGSHGEGAESPLSNPDHRASVSGVLRCIQTQDTPVQGLGFPDGLDPDDGRRL